MTVIEIYSKMMERARYLRETAQKYRDQGDPLDKVEAQALENIANELMYFCAELEKTKEVNP